MEIGQFGMLLVAAVIVLGPVSYGLLFAQEIFEIPRWSVLLYIALLPVGYFTWPPLVLYLLAIVWSLIILSWVWLLWGIVRGG